MLNKIEQLKKAEEITQKMLTAMKRQCSSGMAKQKV
jgi:hypothetical protein